MNELKTDREKRMVMFERRIACFRNWMKCILSGFIFKKRDPSFTYEVIVVDDGSTDETTKVRKRSVSPIRGVDFCTYLCNIGMFCIYVSLLKVVTN